MVDVEAAEEGRSLDPNPSLASNEPLLRSVGAASTPAGRRVGGRGGGGGGGGLGRRRGGGDGLGARADAKGGKEARG